MVWPNYKQHTLARVEAMGSLLALGRAGREIVLTKTIEAISMLRTQSNDTNTT